MKADTLHQAVKKMLSDVQNEMVELYNHYSNRIEILEYRIRAKEFIIRFNSGNRLMITQTKNN